MRRIVLLAFACAVAAAGEPSSVETAFEKAVAKLGAAKTHRIVAGPAVAFDASTVELVWERGSGHGGSLALFRAAWHDDGLRVTRTAIVPDRRRYATPFPPAGAEVEVATTTAPREDARAALALTARALGLRAEPREDVRRAMSSSADFHARIEVRSGDNVVFTESYTGYRSSRALPEYARVYVAGRVLAALVRDAAWKKVAVTDAHRRRLLARTARFDRDGWWVKERLLVMIGAMGDRRFLPFLRGMIAAAPPAGDDVGARRRLYRAINAYAELSGIDRRPNPPETMDVLAVRRAYVERFEKEE